ncbi:MAG: DnaJ domain-containing protein [Synechococcus sp.]
MAASESKDRRRISVELPDSLVNRLDALKDEWGLRARGDCLTRLLEEIFTGDDDENNDDDGLSADSDHGLTEEPETSSSVATALDCDDSVASSFNDERALVLISSGGPQLDQDVEQPQDPPAPRQKRPDLNQGGIDLPGFVRKRTSEIRDSLRQRPQPDLAVDAPLLPCVDSNILRESTEAVSRHWLNLYGKPAGDTVLEAAMTWLGRDIWPHTDGTEGRTFTWSQTLRMFEGISPGWLQQSPRFDQVIVVAGVLEDPFATSELVHRIPTLIRRFVNRFKRSRKVTSFETLESTMTVHGALKLLNLPTIAGASLTLKMIREAYKKQALETHPDAGGSTEAMRRLNEAYQMLRELYRQRTEQ